MAGIDVVHGSPIHRDARAPVNRFGLQGSPGTAYGPAPAVMPLAPGDSSALTPALAFP